jgi:adenylosuccinate synthase
MNVRIVLISGAVASGKSTLSKGLAERFGASVLKTKSLILEQFHDAKSERRELQKLGDELDRKTKFNWVRDAVSHDIRARGFEASFVVVDAIRKTEQVDAIRHAYGPRVFHIHLSASSEELTKRYIGRKGSVDRELSSYSSVRSGSRTEQQISRLESIADAVIATDRCDKEDVLVGALRARARSTG